MNPIAFTFPLAAITVMLFLLWSDSVRRSRRSHPMVYVLRAVLFGVLAGVLIFNTISYPTNFNTALRILVGLAVVIALGGIVYFLRKARNRRTPDDEPLPTLGLKPRSDGAKPNESEATRES